MNKLSIIIYASFFSIIFLGCTNNNYRNNIDLNSKAETISLVSNYELVRSSKDIFENLKIIPLKFKDSTLISGIDKIEINDDSYFVLDKKFTALYKFDSIGNFQNRIGKLGAGANEYRSLEDFSIDSLNRVVSLSNSNQAIFYFNPDGQFLKLKHIGFYNSAFAILSLNKFLYYLSYNDSKKTGPYNFLLTDSNGNINERYLYFNKKKSMMSISFSGFVGSYGKEVLCSDAFNDTIYSLNNEDKLIFKYYVDFNQYSLRKEREDHKLLIDSQKLFKDNIGYLGNVVTFNADNLIFSYTYQNRINYCIYNRRTKSILRVNKSMEDGLLKLLNYPLLISKDNKCYFAVSPEAAIRFKEKNQNLLESLQTDWPDLYAFLKGITINDNYFLVSVDLKQ